MQAVKTKVNPIESAVNEALAAANIHYKAESCGRDVIRGDNWRCDAWRVTFTTNTQADGFRPYGAAPAESESFDYYTGIGHRVNPRPQFKKESYLAARGSEWRAPPPSVAGVLHSLLLDASAEDENFHDWCDNYGYDNDSKKATAIYESCLKNARKLNRVIPRDVREKLSELLQDY